MRYELVVTYAFGPFKVGDVITDVSDIQRWEASHPAHVVRRALPPSENPGPLPPFKHIS